jgi:two-component system response regulator AtoC
LNRQAPPFPPQFLELLTRYEWPGNIRELENTVKRYVIMGSEEDLMNELLGKARTELPRELPENGQVPLKAYTKRAMQEVERELILKVLHENHWNRKKAARQLQISYRALLYKIKQAGLPSKRARAALPVAAGNA